MNINLTLLIAFLDENQLVKDRSVNHLSMILDEFLSLNQQLSCVDSKLNSNLVASAPLLFLGAL